MRHIIYILSFFVISTAFAQKNVSNALKSRLYNHNFPKANFDVLIEGDMQKLLAAEKTLGIKVKYNAGGIACVNVNMRSVSALIETKIAKYIEYIEPNKRLMNDSMIHRNRIKPVRLGTAPLTSSYDGTGVIVGIIDSGTDFNHPDFKDASGNTRISFLWDQTVTTPTNPPMPYAYGEEWTASQINLGVCTHSDVAYWGHGTGVSGIAAGNGFANGTHEGVAANAEIIVVALDFTSAGPTISDAVNYIVGKATAAGKPFVINASVGDYYGSHDGTNSEAKIIDAMISNIPGRAMVAAAGNAGNVKFHTKNVVIPTDTNFTWLQNTGGDEYYWLYADTNNIKNVKYSVGVNSLNYNDLGNIGFKNYNYGYTTQTDTLKNGSNRIGIIESSASVNPYGVYELFVHVVPDSAGYLWRIESTGNGKFDAWNFDFVSSGLPTSAQYPKIIKYTAPDTVSSIVSSFQCSDEIISVANYINRKAYLDVTSTMQIIPENAGELSNNSSCGPTRDGRLKPEVAATGGCILTCIPLSMIPNQISTAPQSVAQGSFHVTSGGTSASSPVVTGLAALFLQAYPNYTNKQVRQAIMNCTYHDGWEGPLPNNKFGVGKLDGFATFTCAALATGIDNQNLTPNASIYPNPFNKEVKVKLLEKATGEICVYNSIGELVFKDKINSDEYILSRNNMKAAGVYFIEIKSKNSKAERYKIVATD
jgi:subtilisin family serine protease